MGFQSFWMFDVFPIIFTIFFLIFLTCFVFILFRSLSQWNKNNHAPRLTVPAKIVAKRHNTTRHHHGTEIHMHHTSTTYYVTFEVESGDRMELLVPSSRFGYLVENDTGNLTFQGTRFLDFQRN